MQITISEDLKEQMDPAKDFYGGYSGLIEKAVGEFFAPPGRAVSGRYGRCRSS
jgi:hypothetical protein